MIRFVHGQTRKDQFRWAAVGVLVLGSALYLARTLLHNDNARSPPRIEHVDIQHVHSGQFMDAKRDQTLTYAGIRAPYDGEPLFAEATRRNRELVEGKQLRLRYDGHDRDHEGRLRAYAFLDGALVNEMLVREGLAYVRLAAEDQLYRTRLLAAQSEARQAKRGLWNITAIPDESSYVADRKYAEFHRESCRQAKVIKPDRLLVFKNKDEAFDAGCAPCPKCRP